MLEFITSSNSLCNNELFVSERPEIFSWIYLWILKQVAGSVENISSTVFNDMVVVLRVWLEKRMPGKINTGEFITPFMKAGDTVSQRHDRCSSIFFWYN